MKPNHFYKLLFLGIVLFAGIGAATAQSQGMKNHKLYAKKAVLTKLSSDFKFTEGPAVDQIGNVYFTDQPNNTIMRWNAANGEIRTYMEKAGRANGLYFDRSGNIIACADEKNQLWKISPSKQVTVLIEGVDGKKLNGPNDLWIAPNGGIYFTDPFYKRPYWTRSAKEIEEEKVYYLSPSGNLSVAAEGFERPNGIIGTADGKWLYVADIKAGKTYRFQIAADGRLQNRSLFTEMGSDGMTLDKKGNLYLTGKGVTVVNADGEKIAHIEVPEPWTANITFGGKKRKTLFITASQSVYTLKMKRKGMY